MPCAFLRNATISAVPVVVYQADRTYGRPGTTESPLPVMLVRSFLSPLVWRVIRRPCATLPLWAADVSHHEAVFEP